MSDLPNSTNRSPLISIWLSPREAIDQVLRTAPRRHVLWLAALAAVADFVAALIRLYGFWPQLLDWRVVAAVILAGATLGIFFLYVWGWLLKGFGKLFGGTASAEGIRAALAWGRAPTAVGTPICFLACGALAFFGIASPSALGVAFRIAAGVLALWSLIWIVRTYKHVQHFGAWRGIASFLLAGICVFAGVFTIGATIGALLFQPFSIPSGSMMPTLLPGDNFFVSKFYRYGSEPQRGDVAAFRLPKDHSVIYIKRIVGLPGDRIQMIDGVLQINGQPVKHERIEDFVGDDGTRVQQYRETLPNGVSFNTLNLTNNGFYDNTPLYTVPAGDYFVIGDNLDNSTDSRILSQVGYVPFENLIGRAEIIFLSTTEALHPTIRFERIGTVIH